MKLPENASARSGEEAGAAQATQVTATDPFQSEAFQIGCICEGVTDIPEVRTYAVRIGARLRSLRKLAVTERRGGYSVTLAEIKFSGMGEIDAPDAYAPTDAERDAIRAAWSRYEWPSYQPRLFTSQHFPRNDPQFPWSFADPENLAICRDLKGELILCVEERRPREDGSKDAYIWTDFSDGRWRIAEPPDALPLYGLATIRDAITIYIHEGPKAAKAMQRLVADDGDSGWRSHPWGAELRGLCPGAVAHVGWLGGAERPRSTDWRPLATSGARLILVCDNDQPGKDASRAISQELGTKLEALKFNDEWPLRFDLADPFPADRAAAGTRLTDLLESATWATDVIPATRGRGQSYQPRRAFIEAWRFTVSPPLFFHDSQPGRGFTETEVNALTRPYSDAEDTARLIRLRPSCQVFGVGYLPGANEGIVERDGQSVMNLWRPTRVKPRPGHCWPLGRLLTHLFPDKADRLHVIRWGATLAARPSTRIVYAIVLRSKVQGLGKTTLAYLLADLVGRENVSTPNEAALTDGSFNSHLARKVLVIVDELYSGHSRKTYNKLKSPITDQRLRVNEKYQPEYEIENFAHFLFTSNDLVPIFLEATDRRFFIPRLAERKLPKAFFKGFHAWLADGGAGIALRCAHEFVDKFGAVEPGEEAPQSSAKAELIDNSVSDEMRSVRDAIREIKERATGDDPQRIAITLDDFQSWHNRICRDRGWKRLNNNRLREALAEGGMLIRGRNDRLGIDQRVRLENGRKHSIACNFEPGNGEEAAHTLRMALTTMSALNFDEGF
jgi:hypothetical protein